jgi:hypothetical protein
MIPLVYSRKYNITAFGLERLHPFDTWEAHARSIEGVLVRFDRAVNGTIPQ